MPFDASTKQRTQRTSFGQKSRASNFKNSQGDVASQTSFRAAAGSRRNEHSSATGNARGRVFGPGAATADRSRAESGTGMKQERRNGRPDKRESAGNNNASKRFSERREGRSGESNGERNMRAGMPRRKEIVARRVSNKPGFTTFQLRLVHSILNTAIAEGRPLDKAYAQWFAKVKLQETEQGFIIRHINAMFRRLGFYAHVAGLKRPSDFQRHIDFLILAYCATEGWPEPEADGTGFDRTGIKKRLTEAQEHPLLREGCPYWLELIGSKELGESWPAERKALGQTAPRFIRANTLKITRDELASRLSDERVVTKSVKGINTALEVTSNSALFRTQAFREGLFEQQDAGSQEIAPFLKVEPGMRVIDACAGSGGKTLHLAALMQNKGTLIALDIEQWKLDDLRKRANRAGVSNIETRLIDSTKVVKRLYEHADRVLIDAPCSGLGVLRRTADSKWSDLTPRLIELKKTQAEILERYSKMAKVGGKVVYSTCSILPSENHEQIRAFLEKHGDEFQLEEEKSILPSSGFDGFYMARLVRIAQAAAPASAPTTAPEPQSEIGADQAEPAAPAADAAASTAETAAATAPTEPAAPVESAEATAPAADAGKSRTEVATEAQA